VQSGKLSCTVRRLPERWSVVATRNISQGSVVERSIVRRVDDQYWFLWQDGQFVFGSGLSQLYNHSAMPNVEVVRDYANMRMYFFAIRDVRQDEELCHCYPDWRRYAIDCETDSVVQAMQVPAFTDRRALPDGMPRVSDSVEVRPSQIDRMGVFARRAIVAGELIELASVLHVANKPWFNWRETDMVFCSGMSHFFAASSHDANVDVVERHEVDLMDFIAKRDVASGEELLIPSRVLLHPCAIPLLQIGAMR